MTALPDERPRIALVTTGGTIAALASHPTQTTGYDAGALEAQDLLDALPDPQQLARIQASPLFDLDSKDIGPSHWLALAQHVRGLIERADIDGVVITHGTDTLEETAYFLHLTLPPGKPVVLTAAMRPAGALSADGPMNLWQALRSACRSDLAEAGVVVVMHDCIWAARDVGKRHPSLVSAIDGGIGGFLGEVDAPRLTRLPVRESRRIGLAGINDLPRIDLLWVAAGSEPDLVQALADTGSAGLVLALPGNASLPARWEEAIAGLRIPVVLCSRAGAGALTPRMLRPGQYLCGLAPLKVRIRLMLGLAAGKRGQRLGEWVSLS